MRPGSAENPLPHEYTNQFPVKEVIVAGDRGPCGGVNMAIETTFEVLDIVNGREPVYANNEPVHNKLITEEFRKQGLTLEPDISEIPPGSILLASAHGWPNTDRQLAKEQKLLVIDTTCQLVTKVQRIGERQIQKGQHVLYVGANNHPEPRGVLGGLPPENYTFIDVKSDDQSLPIGLENGFVTLSQTTLSTEGVKDRVQTLREANPQYDIPDPSGICYATDNRQGAIRDRLFDEEQEPIGGLIVVGSKKSHNSNELKNIGEFEANIPSVLIDAPEEIDEAWFTFRMERIMITSGASVIEPYLQNVLQYFTDRNSVLKLLPTTERDVTFKKPDLTELIERYRLTP